MTDDDVKRWRERLDRDPAMTGEDADELQSHLEDELAQLQSIGLSRPEAFLVAEHRLGTAAALGEAYGAEHPERLWATVALADGSPRGIVTMLLVAAASALTTLIAFLTSDLGADGWFLPNLGLIVLPFVGVYLVLTRGGRPMPTLAVAGIAAVLGIAVNVFPFAQGADTRALIGLHLPIVLWFLIGVLYSIDPRGGRRRLMEFVRFTGEWAIYLALFALGGAILIALGIGILAPVAPVAAEAVAQWAAPLGLGGAVVVAAWLVDAKRSALENIAPVLAAVFTPLLAVLTIASAVVYLVTGVAEDFDRDLLGLFDVLLIAVVAVVIFGLSVRDRLPTPRLTDHVRTAAVVAALVLDGLVLAAMLARIGDEGLTPNRAAALGLNLVLVACLLGIAWLSLGMVLRRSTPAHVQSWTVGYLPVFAVWATLVCVVLPPVFGFR